LIGATLGVTGAGPAVGGADAAAFGGSDGAGVATAAAGGEAGADGVDDADTVAGRAVAVVGSEVATGCAVDGVTADAGADVGRFAAAESDVECVARSST
jgi:hypothetical protein